MKFENGELIKISNQDVDEMIAGIQKNFILREGLCGADLINCDMSDLDFEHFKLLCFDENTKFSKEQQRKFKIDELIQAARVPMKELQEIHSKGMDGKGVKVAIIDTNIDIEAYKEKYGGNIQYVNSEFSGEIEQHGKTVLNSFLQTAPNVEVEFFPFDKTQKEKKAEHFIQYINQIAKDGIKMISLSNSLENVINDKTQLEEIKAFLISNKITLIDSQTFYRDFTYCFRDISKDGSESYKECLCEPEDLQHENNWNKIHKNYQGLLQKYQVDNLEELKIKLKDAGENDILQAVEKFEPLLEFKQFSDGQKSPLYILKQIDKQQEENNRKSECVRIPCGGRTLADKYWGTSSASYSIPVISGLFAICKQLDPQMEYEEFVKICKETSKQVGECNLIQPQSIVEKVKEIEQNDKKRNEFIKELKEEINPVVQNEKVKKENIRSTTEKEAPSIEDDL